jgi:hypothetical protein
VAKYDRRKMAVPQACVYIMEHATKHMKLRAYHSPFVKVSQLSQYQYGQLAKEKKSVADWNLMLFALNQ